MMYERIKTLRKTLNLTQQEFADRIGVKRNTIAQYENGRNNPIDTVVFLICREFSVSEEWLRYGTGEMFMPVPDEFAAYVEDLLSDDDNPLYDIILGIMQTYHGLDAKSKEVVKEFCRELIENLKKMS